MNQDNQNILRRSRKQRAFTQIDNEIANNENLSWQAKGMMLYLLSKPEDWKFYESDIVKHAKNGPDSVRSIIKELLEYGYLMRGERLRDERGYLKGYNYIIEPYLYESYDGKSYIGKSYLGKSKVGKTYVGKSEDSNTNSSNTDSLNNTNLSKTEGKGETAPQSPFIDNDFLAIKIYYEQNVIYAQSSFSEDKRLIDMLDDYRDHLLIIEAMKIAVERGKPKLAYINGILKGWRNEDGITNHKQLEAHRKRGGERGANQPNTSNDDGKKSRIQEANARRAALLRGESYTAN